MIELLTTAEMTEADRQAIAAGTPGIDLMERAGLAVADVAGALAGKAGARRVAIVAGPGNNGGDGFVAARLLAERGHAVRLLLAGHRDRLKGDAARAADRWNGSVELAEPAALAGSEIVVDALFGAGLTRDVEGAPRAMIDAINVLGTPVIAVDLPSGIDGDSGAVRGAAVRAAETVTFFRRKPGHLLMPGREYCGRVHVADIGIPERVLEAIRPNAFANEPPLWWPSLPRPATEGHKYGRGHAVVVSGGLVSTGAARLAARGALRIGAGLVTIASPWEALPANAAENLAVMVKPVDGATELAVFMADARRNALVLGPGGGVGELMREQVAAGLACGAAVVLDADALTSFAGSVDRLGVAIGAVAGRPVVLTPHSGEFSRLFKDISSNSKSNSKLELTRAAARSVNAVVLLKGADTVVAAPDGRASITAHAPPTLATAGSGDVLAGMIAGLLAQGMPAFEAASAAVWMHGDAALRFGPGLISEDLPEQIPAVLRGLSEAMMARTPGQGPKGGTA